MEAKWSINPDSISSLSPKDQALFVQYALGKRVTVPFKTIHEAFKHHARLQASTVAIEHLDESITYGELDYRSDELAWRLREKGVRPGARVMLLARRSIPYCVAILAVLKAGGSLSLGYTDPVLADTERVSAGQYVPVDGTIATDSTIHHILVDAAVNVVVCMEAFVHRVVYAGELSDYSRYTTCSLTYIIHYRCIGLDVVLLESSIQKSLEDRVSGTKRYKVQDLSSGDDG